MPMLPPNDGLTKIIALQIYETDRWYPCEVFYQTVGITVHNISTFEADKSNYKI